MGLTATIGIGGLASTLVFGGILPAAFRTLLPRRHAWILAGLLGVSVAGGVVMASALRFAFGSIEGSIPPVAAAVALALPLAGLNECLGPKGFTLAAMTMMFVGTPFAGIATGSQWLPAGVAMVGQLLPPGAAGTLVRSAAYFGGPGGGTSLVVLSAWALARLILWFVGSRLRRTTTPDPGTPVEAA